MLVCSKTKSDLTLPNWFTLATSSAASALARDLVLAILPMVYRKLMSPIWGAGAISAEVTEVSSTGGLVGGVGSSATYERCLYGRTKLYLTWVY